MIATERKSDLDLTTDTPYLAITDQLWGAYYGNSEANWTRYNGTALYLVVMFLTKWRFGKLDQSIRAYFYIQSFLVFHWFAYSFPLSCILTLSARCKS